MELKTTKVYVPTDAKDEFPDKQDYINQILLWPTYLKL